MALTLLPTAVLAADAESVTVGGVTLVSGQYLANGANAASEERPTGGYAYFDGVVLTLSDAVVTTADQTSDHNYAIYADGDLTIILTGSNTVVAGAADGEHNGYGIYTSAISASAAVERWQLRAA